MESIYECMCCGEKFGEGIERSLDKELCTECYDDVVDHGYDDAQPTWEDLE